MLELLFFENNRYYWHVFLDEWLYEIWMKSKNKLKEIGIKNRVCYYFDDIINGLKIKLVIFY